MKTTVKEFWLSSSLYLFMLLHLGIYCKTLTIAPENINGMLWLLIIIFVFKAIGYGGTRQVAPSHLHLLLHHYHLIPHHYWCFCNEERMKGVEKKIESIGCGLSWYTPQTLTIVVLSQHHKTSRVVCMLYSFSSSLCDPYSMYTQWPK